MKIPFTLAIALVTCSSGLAASYDEWSKSVSYPYSREANQKDRLLQQYKKISGAITEPAAIKILGQPDYIVPFYTKWPNQVFKGNIYKYVIYKKHEEFVNVKHDQYITLYFNPIGNPSSMHPQNIPELKELRFE